MIRNYEGINNQPLFLKISFARPHSPYDPPQRLLDEYANRDIPAPWIGEWCKDKPYAKLKDPQKVKKMLLMVISVTNMQKTHGGTIMLM